MVKIPASMPSETHRIANSTECNLQGELSASMAPDFSSFKRTRTSQCYAENDGESKLRGSAGRQASFLRLAKTHHRQSFHPIQIRVKVLACGVLALELRSEPCTPDPSFSRPVRVERKPAHASITKPCGRVDLNPISAKPYWATGSVPRRKRACWSWESFGPPVSNDRLGVRTAPTHF